MSEVRLVVREADRDWSGTMHGSDADRAIAALSADPVTLEELEHAVGRFARPSPHGPLFANLRPGLHNEPHDAGLIVIDLLARLVAIDSSFSSPGKEACERAPIEHRHRPKRRGRSTSSTGILATSASYSKAPICLWPKRLSTRSSTASRKRLPSSRWPAPTLLLNANPLPAICTSSQIHRLRNRGVIFMTATFHFDANARRPRQPRRAYEFSLSVQDLRCWAA
jgi:hypothetical protein